MKVAQLYTFAFSITTFLFATGIMAGKVTNPSRVPKNAVLLSKVSSLTLRNGKLTSSRRVDAAPQLECVGPKEVCKLYQVDVMRCANDGADYDADNIQWSCKASLPEEFKLGSTDVICEGYESSDDPYVLKGSCGVEYRLILTDKGEEKYGSILQPYKIDLGTRTGSGTISTLFVIVFVVVLFIILRGMWSRWNENPPRLGRPRPAGGNNTNNNDDDDDPPPPYDGPPSYDQQPPRPQTKKTTSRTSTSTRASSSRSASQNTTQEGWRPGFWTGTAAGAAAGYYAGTRGQAQQRNQTQDIPRQAETQQRPGGLFSSFLNPQQRTQAAPSAPSTSSSSSPTFSTTRHESTGFGSTRRR